MAKNSICIIKSFSYNAEHQNDIIAEDEIAEDNDEGNAFNIDDTHEIIPTNDRHQALSTQIVDKSVVDDNIKAALLPTPGNT